MKTGDLTASANQGTPPPRPQLRVDPQCGHSLNEAIRIRLRTVRLFVTSVPGNREASGPAERLMTVHNGRGLCPPMTIAAAFLLEWACASPSFSSWPG